jgi:hypothetical protein
VARFLVAPKLKNPLSAQLLGVLRGWWKVVLKGRGGELVGRTPWTRVTGEEFCAQLAREFHLEVSRRQVYAALRELEAAGLVQREQRWRHRYDRRAWFAPTEDELVLLAASPSVVAAGLQGGGNRAAAAGKLRSGGNGHFEKPRPVTSNSKAPRLTTHNSKSGARFKPQPSSRNGKGGFSGVLRQVVEACTAKGGSSLPAALEPAEHGTVVLVGDRRWVVNDGPCAPLR